jgi:hypothetical protein
MDQVVVAAVAVQELQARRVQRVILVQLVLKEPLAQLELKEPLAQLVLKEPLAQLVLKEPLAQLELKALQEPAVLLEAMTSVVLSPVVLLHLKSSSARH